MTCIMHRKLVAYVCDGLDGLSLTFWPEFRYMCVYLHTKFTENQLFLKRLWLTLFVSLFIFLLIIFVTIRCDSRGICDSILIFHSFTYIYLMKRAICDYKVILTHSTLSIGVFVSIYLLLALEHCLHT